MAIKTQPPAKLTNVQKIDLINLRQHIDFKLKKKCNLKKKKVIMILTCEVPDNIVLTVINTMYKKYRGWDKIEISLRAKTFYKENCYWTLQFTKHT